MLRSLSTRVWRRPFLAGSCAAVAILLTVAATWLWAHEGHQPLPSRGAWIDPSNRNRVIVQADAREALGVETQEVVARNITEKVVAPATVVAPWQRFAFATSQLSGRVTRVSVQPGQAVSQGQVLAEVQSLELENLHLHLLEAQNEVRLARETLADLKAAQDAVAGQQLADAEARSQEAQNGYDLAWRKLLGLGIPEATVQQLTQERAGRSAQTLPIRSVLNGVVSRVHVQVGQVIEPTHHLFEIVDASNVWVKIAFLEKDLALVEPGLPVEVRLTARPGDVFRSTIQSKSLALDPASHQGIAWADFSNGPAATDPARQLLPGMYGQAEIILPHREKLLTVPMDAVIRDGAEHYVLVETAPGQYERQYVHPGRRSPEFVELRAGTVLAGDRVVTVGGHELASHFGQEVLRLSPEAAAHLQMETEQVQKHALAAVVTLPGEVEFPPDRRAVASARLAGAVHRLHVEREQMVQAGDILAEVASLELQTMQLELLREHLRLQLLEQTVARLRAQATQGGTVTLNRRQLREAQSAATAAVLKRDTLRLKLEAVGLSTEQIERVLQKRQMVAALPVRAPIAGTVVSLRAALGQSVKPEDPLVEIHDSSGALIRGFVSERQFARVQVGQSARVRLTAEPNWVGLGKVVRSSQEFQTADRTLSVWVQLQKPPRQSLRHGLLASLTLISGKTEAVLSVPRSALLREGTQEFVFVRQEDGIFERRRVQTGRNDDLRVEIIRGLAKKKKEEVATRGIAELQTGYAGLK